MQNANSIFTEIGYNVLSITNGVYRLMAADGLQQFVAVLRGGSPLPVDARSVELALYPLEIGEPLDRVLAHWQNLDARRLESPAVTVTSIGLPAGVIPSAPPELAYLRPDGSGLRYAVRLTTGDIVCFN